jgi:hypothetical protein
MKAPSKWVTAVLRSIHSNTTATDARPRPEREIDCGILAHRAKHEGGVRHCPDKREPREYEPGHK